MHGPKHKPDVLLGAAGAGFALAVLAAWIPADTGSGVVDVWRRQVRIGDAMLPVFASAGILASGAAIALRAMVQDRSPEEVAAPPRQLAFLILCLAVLALSVVLMRFAGPALVWLLLDDGQSYRLLIDQFPWSWSGFVLGGTAMVFAFISLCFGRISGRAAGIAVIAACAVAALYTLPFDNLLLPPNGDF